MMWQDLVFLVGSLTSVMFLYPTLRNKASQVPRATSIPSMIIGGAYSFTFLTLGMTFSATGSFAACTMWSLIAAFRSPDKNAANESSIKGTLKTLKLKIRSQFSSTHSTDSPECNKSRVENDEIEHPIHAQQVDEFDADYDGSPTAD